MRLINLKKTGAFFTEQKEDFRGLEVLFLQPTGSNPALRVQETKDVIGIADFGNYLHERFGKIVPGTTVVYIVTRDPFVFVPFIRKEDEEVEQILEYMKKHEEFVCVVSVKDELILCGDVPNIQSEEFHKALREELRQEFKLSAEVEV